MPIEQYKKAVQLMLEKQSDDGPRLIIGKGVSEAKIAWLEKRLGIRIPALLRHYFQEFGYLSFGGTEFYGLWENNIESDIVNITINLREKTHLSNSILPIYSDSAAAYRYGLNLAQKDENGESPVIVFYVGYAIEDYKPEVVAEDFGTFLLHLVEDEIRFWEEEK